MAHLVVIAGLPGTGKTTLSRRLEAERGAFRLCPDEWMAALGIDLWDGEARQRIERLQRDLAQRLLTAGADVVIEWGTWSRAERDALRDFARAVGATAELRFLDEPLDVLWERVRERALEGPRQITRDELERWSAEIERPTLDELAAWDA